MAASKADDSDFTTDSQENVRYGGFTNELFANFEVEKPHICLGEVAGFTFADSCFGVENALKNLSFWEWDFGDGTISQEVNPRHAYSSAGSYPVRLAVQDVHGCADTVVKYMHVHPLPEVEVVQENVSCFSASDGMILLNEVQGSLPFTYTWQPVVSHGSMAADLMAGDYEVGIEDQYGCRLDLAFSITEPDPLELLEVEHIDTYCSQNHGSVQIEATGGNGSVYTYLWNTIPPQTGKIATDLGAGTYTMKVTDKNGCSETLETVIGDDPPPEIMIASDPDYATDIPISKATLQFFNFSERAINISMGFWG